MALFRERIDLSGCAAQVPLRAYIPVLKLEGLLTGIDNLRHDVHLSPRLVELGRAHVARLVVQCGDVRDLCTEEPAVRPPSIVTRQAQRSDRVRGRTSGAVDGVAQPVEERRQFAT
jgi:hypothetical protein